MMNLDNCPRCGKLFAKNIRDICPACMMVIDKEYELCANYLRKNRGANITEVAEVTSVSMRQIIKFIREGRISLIDAPNLTYPCEVCGTLIRDNHICGNCRQRLANDVSKMNDRDQDGDRSNSTSSAYRIKDRY